MEGGRRAAGRGGSCKASPRTAGRLEGHEPMTRTARRASLLVVFSLLTSAATAYAECAWVLWWSDNKNTTWSILDAFPKLADCDQSLNGDMNALKRDGYEVHGAPGTGHGFD